MSIPDKEIHREKPKILFGEYRAFPEAQRLYLSGS